MKCITVLIVLAVAAGPAPAADPISTGFEEMQCRIDVSGSLPDQLFTTARDKFAEVLPEQVAFLRPLRVVVSVIGDDYQLFDAGDRVFNIPQINEDEIRQRVYQQGVGIGAQGKAAYELELRKVKQALADTLSEISKYIRSLVQGKSPCSAIDETFQTRIPQLGAPVFTQILTDLNSTCADTGSSAGMKIAPTLVYYVPSEGDDTTDGRVIGCYKSRARWIEAHFPGAKVVPVSTIISAWRQVSSQLLTTEANATTIGEVPY